ncbi:SpoIIE family protein phosphatase [Blastococcus sp. CT_GayMR16]|uniref:SpoIIE family protein phosphatase n=1 Tax=Blastococcus sp. CT_GayMR16 TaxID=2559607 RepID=UPI001073752B|nr:SpoIIE family protein phosphatase [Blastococcus sp. CT_GayMR16]TFV88217.1 PAS domain-containing protein [Blastococcus sp. CT_GayMR16]
MSAAEPNPIGTVPVDFQLLFTALPTAFLVMDPDLVIVEANPAYLELVGRRRDEIVGRPVFEAFPPAPDALDESGRNPIEISFERARDTGVVDPMPIAKYDVLDPVTGKLGERYWSLISAPVLDAAGRTVLVLQRTEDVSAYVRERSGQQVEPMHGMNGHRDVEAVEADLYARVQELRIAQEARDTAARRLSSLAEVAIQLTTAETVEDLERVVVSRGLAVLGADGGGIISPDDHGGWRATLSDALGEDVQLAYGNVPYDSPLPAPWVARTGQEKLLPTRESGLAFDRESMAGVYADIGRYGWAFLPLSVNDMCVGSLAVAWAEEHPFGADELELMRVFAAQCAQVLVRIRATAAQRAAAVTAQKMSETLQRSLLTQPPTPESLQIAVRYQPASQGAHVGGDWYDAFRTVSGATMLVVGDVTGHDRTAAATMGQLRNLLRGLAYDSDDSPAELLSRLDAAMDGLQVGTLATAVLGRVELHGAAGHRTWRLRWGNAGHLPPLLRRPDGTVEVLAGRPELLLGLDARASRSEHVVDLVAGDTVLFYSDGLVERRKADLDQGIDRLADALSRAGALDPEELCDRLLAEVGMDINDDDIALLVLRPGEEPT